MCAGRWVTYMYLLVLVVEPELSRSPPVVVEAAGVEEDKLADRRWELDIYVVSEHVTTYGSPYFRTGLYQHTPHNDNKEMIEVTEMFTTGSINVVGVSLSSGLVSFFQSFESLSGTPGGEADFADLFMTLNTRDSFFIVYTHRATQKTSRTLSQLLQFCRSSSIDLLDADGSTESLSYVFVGQCSTIPSERGVWKEYKLIDYLPIRLKAKKYVEEDKRWYINASTDILQYPDDYRGADGSGFFNFKPPHFTARDGYDVPVLAADSDGNDMGTTVLHMCRNERPEDAVDRLARQLLFQDMNGTYYQMLLGHLCGLLNDVNSDMHGRYRVCDGKPSSRIVGVIEKDFYVRVGYSVDEVYECYCTAVPSSQCGSKQPWLSPEYAYISRTLEGDARRQKQKEEEGAAAADVAISLGVTCATAMVAVSLQWRQTKAQGYLTGPFDLMLSNYEGLVRCIQDDFRLFTDSKYLEIFDYEANHGVEMGKNCGLFYESGRYVRNTYYNFVLPHESPVWVESRMAGEDWKATDVATHYIENDYFFFKERYERRINNFRHYMKSGAKITIFMSASVYDVSQLEAAIKAQYPRAKFNIHVLIDRVDIHACRNDYYFSNLLNTTSSYFR